MAEGVHRVRWRCHGRAFTNRKTVVAMGVVLFVLGVAVGAIGVWLLLRRYRIDLATREAEFARITAVREVEVRALVERHDGEVTRLQERLATGAEQHRIQLAAAEARVDLVRGDREQLRRDVQAVSADVLRKTGEALARENAAQRLADQERAAGRARQAHRGDQADRRADRAKARADGGQGRPARAASAARPTGAWARCCAHWAPAWTVCAAQAGQPQSRRSSAPRRAARGARSSCAT